jgi:hypothetical protein
LFFKKFLQILFNKKTLKKNLGIIIAITLTIATSVIAFQIFSNDTEQKKIIDKPMILGNITSTLPDLSDKTPEEISEIIDQKYSDIINNKADYEPLPRVWQSSGPFKIDRENYVLAEKIFLIAENIDYDENGKIILLRPFNQTHSIIWSEFPFDGKSKTAFNIYFEPQLSQVKNICTKNDLIGEWTVTFEGTNYPDLKFVVIDKVLPGSEVYFLDEC